MKKIINLLIYILKHKFIISLFITSFVPLWISIIFIELFSIFNAENLFKTTEYIVISTIIIVNLFCIIYMHKKISWFIKNQKEPAQKLKSIVKEKTITTEYLLSYILPLFTFDFTQWKQIILFLIFFTTLSFLCLKNKNIYSNIILELNNYSFYTCVIENDNHIPTTVFIISKNNLSKKINTKLNFSRIDDDVCIDITSKL